MNADVSAALDRVVDPCSSAMGMPLGLVAMGLVKGIQHDTASGTIEVRLRLTSPCCAYGEVLADAARRELEQLPAVVTATVVVDYSAGWTPVDISHHAHTALAARRATTVALTGVQPYDWTNWELR